MKTLHHLLCAIAALPCAYAQDAVSFNNDTYGVDDAEGTPYQTFKSNPDVKPPVLQIHKNETGGLADGLVFVGVNGGPSSGQNWPTIWGAFVYAVCIFLDLIQCTRPVCRRTQRTAFSPPSFLSPKKKKKKKQNIEKEET